MTKNRMLNGTAAIIALVIGIISKGKGNMPAFEKSLGADSCKAVAGYLRE